MLQVGWDELVRGMGMIMMIFAAIRITALCGFVIVEGVDDIGGGLGCGGFGILTIFTILTLLCIIR